VTRGEPDYAAEACAELLRLMGVLEGLMTEPPSGTGAPVRGPVQRAEVPEPYRQAGVALMTAHEGLRRLEASLREVVTGERGRRRGGSDRNTELAARLVADLASQITGPAYSRACRYLDEWLNGAKAVDGIDEVKRWRHIGRAATCPYCGCGEMLADMERGVVVCALPGCKDRDGNQPVASMGTDEHGVPELAWNDGRRQTAPDLGAAA
jgi:hypothetical protein